MRENEEDDRSNICFLCATKANTASNYGYAISLVSCQDSKSWIPDTGATNHMNSRLDWLCNLKFNSSKVHLPNGGYSKVEAVGDFTLGIFLKSKQGNFYSLRNNILNFIITMVN